MSGDHNKYCSANNPIVDPDWWEKKYGANAEIIKHQEQMSEYFKGLNAKYPEEDNHDAVNPKHYDLFPEYRIQVRELMQVLCDKLDKQGYSGFLASDYVQAMQYFLRWFEKNGEEDISKGIWYMQKILEQLKEKEI